MTYYAQRKSIKGNDITFNNRTGNKEDMLRQYYLYCASASTNEAKNNYDYVDFGTIERGVEKAEKFKQNVQPEPPETEQEQGEPTV